MRKITVLILAGIVAVAVTGTLAAQNQPDIAGQRTAIQKDRNSIVAASLALTTDQTTTFWPLYKQYRADMVKVGDRMEKLIRDYAAGYNTTLTDEQAAALLKEFLAIQKEALKVREQYVPRFSAILPAKSVMRFYQIENKLDASVTADLVSQVPLAK